LSTPWLCIPSARPDGGTIGEWRDKGYRIAVWRDPGSPALKADYFVAKPYPGYAVATNHLVQAVMMIDSACEWLIGGGDDVSPDLAHSPEEIAEDCSSHFCELDQNRQVLNGSDIVILRASEVATFGVMQCTGDRWGADEPWARKNWPQAPAYIDRICGSPWMGREFCRRANAGKGPLCEDYEHMYVDEHLQEYAKQLGILWQRPDLIQYHHHALRGGKSQSSLPPHLKCRYEGSHFKDAKAIFDRHMAEKFAGLEPIA